MFFVLYVADYELSCLQSIQLLTSGRYVWRDFKITLTKKCRKKSKSPASNVRVNLKNGIIIEMLFLDVNMTVEALFLLYLQEKFAGNLVRFSLIIFTWQSVFHTCDVKSRDRSEIRMFSTWRQKSSFRKIIKKNKFRRYVGNFTKERYYMSYGNHRELEKKKG